MKSQYSDALKPNKLLGQHFLRSRDIIRVMISAGKIKNTDTVLEVGPGTGTLTQELAAAAKSVIAVEKDARITEFLKSRFAKAPNVRIIEGDILKINARNIGLKQGKYAVIANIPYYLTTHFLRLFLSQNCKPSRMILMVQYEVARRITSRAPHANLLSLSVGAYGSVSLIKKIHRGSFHPPPAVDSAIISISKISGRFFKKNGIGEKKFFSVLRRAFSQKRKMLRNSIGIQSKKRPEELSLAAWAKIIKAAR